MIKLSARVIEVRDGEDVGVAYYVRSVDHDRGLFGDENSCAIDAWAAYREDPVSAVLPGSSDAVRLLRVVRVSTVPRATPEQAAEDMYAAVRAHVDPDRLRNPAHLIWGDVPEVAQVLGSDPMGDAAPAVEPAAPALATYAFIDPIDGTDFGTFEATSGEAALLAMVKDASFSSVESAEMAAPAWLARLTEAMHEVTTWTVVLKYDCTAEDWEKWSDLDTSEGIVSHGATDDQERWTVTAPMESGARAKAEASIKASGVAGITIVSIEPDR